MTAIPVPVHFDGHNINIITEDSPTACKNRTKGMNRTKNKKKKGIQNGKYPNKSVVLSKISPNSDSNSSKLQSPSPVNTSENNSVLSNSNAPKTSPSNKENATVTVSLTQTPNAPTNSKPNTAIIKPVTNTVHIHPDSVKKSAASPLPLPHKPQFTNNSNTNGKVLGPLGPLPLPPRNPNIIPRNNNSTKPIIHSANPNIPTLPSNIMPFLNNPNAMHTLPLPLDIDPNEFGSHDDIGFDDDDSQNNGKDRQNLYKTELCREWSTSGWCYYNKRCSFAHGLQELRPVFRSKKWRTKRCRNWHTTGYCPYEHRCQFLHDQSPPRRISDYATANARALVAAQQRMQPLYFHYQVDCNRDDTTDDDNEDKTTKKGSHSKANTPDSQSSPSIGPRLKRGKNRKNKSGTPPNINTNKGLRSTAPMIEGKRQGQLRMINRKNNNQNSDQNNPTLRMINANNRRNNKGYNNGPIHGGLMPNHIGMNQNTLRMLNQSKNKNPNIKKGKNNNKKKRDKTRNQLNNAKKKPKEAVITPFNPVGATYAGGVNGVNVGNTYEMAAQQLGLYNPAQALALQTLPNMMPAGIANPNGVNVNVGGQLVPNSLNILPPLPITTLNTTFQTLPPSIDPSLYLSLTPSPPTSPRQSGTNANHVKKSAVSMPGNVLKPTAGVMGNGQGLNVSMPVSLTPSPPSLAAVHPNIVSDGVPQLPAHALGMVASMSSQQVQIQLAKQQQTLQALHAKVQEVAQQQAAQHAEQQAAIGSLLATSVNKSQTPIAPIDGAMLESLLPTDDKPMNGTEKSGDNVSVTNIITNSAPNHSKVNVNVQVNVNSNPNPSHIIGNKSDDVNAAKLPPIPPIPPPLQLQTSINSVVNGAVAAAMNSTTAVNIPNSTQSVSAITASNQKASKNNNFGYPQSNTPSQPQTTVNSHKHTVPVTTTTTTSVTNVPSNIAYPLIEPYAQQAAHAHAHAYASAHLTGPNAYTTYHTHPAHAYANPNQIPLQQGHMALQGIPPLQQIQGIQGLPHGIGGIQGINPLQYPPFYAPSPDFQEVPQQQYYTTNYTHHQVPRHHY